MKNPYLKDIIRTIHKHFKRFIAILAITALGLTAFCGITAACRNMYLAADRFYDRQRLFDVRVLSTLGLTEDDAAALQAVGGIDFVEGGYSETVRLTEGDVRKSAEMRMLGFLNTPYLVEGRLPQASGDIAVTEKYLTETCKHIGDTVKIEEDLSTQEAAGPAPAAEGVPGAASPFLEEKSEEDAGLEIEWDAEVEWDDAEAPTFPLTLYTISGVVVDPMDVASDEGTSSFRFTASADYTFFVLPGDVNTDIYTVLSFTVQGARQQDCYSSAYENMIQSVIHTVETQIMRRREKARDVAVRAEALEKITDAEQLMEENFADAEEQFSEAWAELEEGRQELAEGETRLRLEEQDAHRQLADARHALEMGEAQLAESESRLAEALKTLQAGQQEQETGLAAYEAAFAEYEAGRAALSALAQDLGSLSAAKDGMRALLDAYGPALGADPAAVEQFAGTAAGVAATLDGMQAFFSSAQQPEMETLAASTAAAIRSNLETAGVAGDYESVYQAVQTLYAPLNPMDSTPEAPTPYSAMAGAVAQAAAQIDAAAPQWEPARLALAEGAARLEEGWRQYNDGLAQLEAGRARLSTGESELAAQEDTALRELADAWQELAAGKQELADGEAELLDAERTYRLARADAKGKLADAYREWEEIEEAQWYVQSRTSIDSYAGLDSDLDSIGAIGRAFPVLFLVVAVLISLTTMARMVEEERGLLGLYMALGFSDFAIAKKYVLYALLASLAGSGAGCLLGFFALPKLLIYILRAIYIIPNTALQIDLPYALAGTLLFLGCNVFAAAFACRAELAHVPAALMRPKAPRVGGRIFLEHIPAAWARLTFLNKVTARNLFRYKKRLFMTVVGVAGCTALVLAGFAIRDSVTDLAPGQYGRIYRYDLLAVAGEEDSGTLMRLLEEDSAISAFLPVQISSVKVLNAAGETETMQMVVTPGGEALGEYIRTPGQSQAEAYPDNEGILITQNAADFLGFSVGSTATLQNLQLEQRTVKIADVVENYLGNSVYLSRPLYERLFGGYEVNAAYARLADGAPDAAAYARALAEQEAVLSSISVQEMREQFTTDFAILNYVLYILLVLAAGLAFAVLFTLSNTNISERTRELATIKVLGFFDREVHAYVNKEVLVLTLFGVLLGLPLGYGISGLLLAALKMPSIQFSLVVQPFSYLAAGAIAFSFALLVTFLTNLSLNRIDMVQALKSVE